MTAFGDAALGVRATRARPPGRAGDGARRGTYGAALSQFDELLAAARTAGPASRPVALFYALSQAGRAIAAAHGEVAWRLYGHGLEAPALDAPDMLTVEVRRPRRPRPKAVRSERIDSFAGVADATRCALPSEAMALGQLWAALPSVSALLDDPRWPPAVAVFADEPGAKTLFAWDRVSATLVSFTDLTAAAVSDALLNYSAANDVRLQQPQGIELLTAPTPAGLGARVHWPSTSPDLNGQCRALDAVAPLDVLANGRWLRPRVGGAAMTDLMVWWALLFGLSMLARYEPDGWTSALDYDRSPLAVPLAALLDAALDAVPELVLAALDA